MEWAEWSSGTSENLESAGKGFGPVQSISGSDTSLMRQVMNDDGDDAGRQSNARW